MPRKEALLPRQTLLPSPALSLPEKLVPLQQPHPGKEAFLPRQVLPLPEKLVPLWQPSHPGKGSIPSHASTPPPREASTSLATATLPGEGSSSSQVTALPPLGEGSNSSQAVSLPREGNSSPHSLRSTQADQGSNPTRSFRQGNRHPPSHRSTQASQEVNTTSWEGNTSSTPLLGLPKVLPMKNLTLSGSSTSPTYPWHQLKGLFWLKDPTLWLPPGSLPT